MLKGKIKKSLAFLLCSVITMQPGISAIAADMPSGAVIQSGKVKIAKINPNHIQIDQTTTKSVINWNSFSVHKGGRVDFNMPSSNSSSLNRVLGSTPSSIAGQINSNGQVILVNPNGVFLTKTGMVNSSSFIASSLNIQTSDFLNDSYTFSGLKKSRGVENHGKINVKNYGNVSLLGGYASNTGVINARLGKIFIGGGEKITLDFVGTGLMNIVVPTSHLENVKDINGNSLSSLVTNTGSLSANGGVVQLAGQTAENLMLGSVNIGQSGIVSATTVDQTTGNIIIGGGKNNFVNLEGKIDLSSSSPSTPAGNLSITGTNVYYGGTTNASGSIGGKISVKAKEALLLDSSIVAKGLKENGGDLMVVSEDVLLSTTRTNIDMSGLTNGGSIKLHADNHNLTAGKFQADGNLGKGGYIDFAGQNVGLAAADISASGASQGGKVRIGGEYLGGQKLSTVSQREYDGFVNRFDNRNDIINAKKTIVDYDVNINISSDFGQGGTAVVWSEETTDFMGSIDANGYLSSSKNWITQSSNTKERGGYIEISSKNLLRTINLDRVSVDHGTLLLDPRNITVDGSSGSGASLDNGLRAQVYSGYYNDNLNFFYNGRSQHGSSWMRNKYNRDFTKIDYQNPGYNFAEYYSVEWRGFFKPQSTGNYQFATYSDDASHLWIEGISDSRDTWSEFLTYRSSRNWDVNNGGAHGMRWRNSGQITLQADTYYPILIYFGERGGGDRIDVNWRNASVGGGWTRNLSGYFFHNNQEFSTGEFTGATGGADIATVNAFNTDSSSSNAIGSSTIQDLLKAGTDVYLRANQDITVSNAINVTGSSGGNLSLLAGRDITINSNITTANGDLTLRANTSTSYGVVDSQRGSGTADITNNATINAGSGTVTAVMDGGAGLTNDQPGNISLGTITAGAINAIGDSAAGAITGTSLTASNNSGTTVNISGYEIGTISTISTLANNTNWRVTRLNSSTDNSFSNLPSADFIQYGYSSGDSVNGSGNGIMTGYDPGVLTKTYSTISGTSKKVTKVYDGTTSTSSATFGNATVTSVNGLSSDLNVTLSTQTYTYGTKGASDSKVVTADSAYSISSASHSRHGDVYGLEASSTAKQINNAQVTKKPVSLSGTRQYDGTTSIDSSDLTVGNFVGSETVTLSGSGSLSSADVQSNSNLSSTSGLSLVNGSGGGLASNYTLTGGSQSVNVTKRPVVISGKREYDGTNTISASDVSFVGTVGSDDLSVSGKMTVNDADVGSNKSVSMRSAELQDGSNGKASNYELVSGTFSITKKQVTAKLSKVYDGSKEVLNTALESVTGLVGKEKLALSGSANISDPNAGSTKIITSHDLSLADSSEQGASGKASNYELKTLVIDVAKRNLEIVGEKIYDSSVAVKDSIFTKISGLVGNEDISVSGSTISLTKADAGDHNISKDSLTLKDGKSGLATNYSLNSAMVTVKKKPVKISGSGKFERSSNRNMIIDKRALRLQNVEKNDKIDLSGIALISGIAEGARDLIVSKLSLVGDKAKNYTLVGESHKFLVKLNERFKAKTKITNKLNALQRSGKKIVTGATQAMPKVAALAPPSAPNLAVSTPSPSGGVPSAPASTAASPTTSTGGASSQAGSSSGGGSTGSSSSSGGETGGNESSSDETN